jgi:hypothetical protein
MNGRRHGELVFKQNVKWLIDHKTQPVLPVGLLQPHEGRGFAINLKRARRRLQRGRFGWLRIPGGLQ